MEICVESGTLRFTGSGSSMRKAKQAAASLALNEVGFKQFKTKQSRVEVGEGSSKAKEVEKILAKSLVGESGREQRTSQMMSNSKEEVEAADSAKVGSSSLLIISFSPVRQNQQRSFGVWLSVLDS